ncbi:ABC transporter ATP-binding protein [Planctomycetota bacterium]
MCSEEKKAAKIETRAASKRYGDTWALCPTSLRIMQSERVAVVGLSGSGKTTLLHLMAGILSPSEGIVSDDGRPMDTIPLHQRDVGLACQQPLLFPHLSVRENVEFPLRVRRRRGISHDAGQARKLLERLGLDAALDERFPHELSGGQAQRVSLARALVHHPSLLLLDEPLSSLDRPMRESLLDWLMQYHEENRPTLVHVTHDSAEAMRIGQRLLVLRGGRVVQDASPQEVYQAPADLYVARLLGPLNVLQGALVDCACPNGRCFALRPEAIHPVSGPVPSTANVFEARVRQIIPAAPSILLHLENSNNILVASVAYDNPGMEKIHRGTIQRFWFERNRVMTINTDGGKEDEIYN